MPPLTLRAATVADARCLSVLAMQVFLDTYATQGIDADLADEVLQQYGEPLFASRLQDASRWWQLAQCGQRLVAFVDVARGAAAPLPGVVGHEVARLYVQAPFQRQGLGRRLLAAVAQQAREAGAPALWLTAWAGNTRALAFYAANGWRDVGRTTYHIAGRDYENRVLVLPVHPA